MNAFTDLLLNNIEEAIWAVDKDLNLIAFNAAFKSRFSALFGKEIYEGMPLSEMAYPELYVYWEKQYQRGLKGERFTVDYETTLNNIHYVFMISISPVVNEKGEIYAIAFSSRDVTNRLVSEKTLERTRNELSRAQIFAKIGWWKLNLKTMELILSKEKQMLIGMPAPGEELLQMSLEAYGSQYVLPEDLPIIQYAVGQLIQNSHTPGYQYTLDYRAIDTSQQIKYFHLHCEITPEGYVSGFTQDVSLRKQAENELRAQKQFMEQVLNTIPNMVFVKDIEGKFVLVNHAVAKMYGTSAEFLVGKGDKDFNPNTEEVEHYAKYDQMVILTGKPHIIPEESVTNPTNGEVRFFQTVKVPLLTEGESVQMLGVSTDITERKKAEEERVQLMEDLVRNVQDLEQFAYIVSHNLRSPVARILGLTKLIEGVENQSDLNKVIFRGLIDEAKQLDNVIFDLNTIVGIRNSQDEKRSVIVIKEILDIVVNSLRSEVEKYGVEIQIDTSEVNALYAIRTYVHSIFQNLISNSIKYHHPERKPEITIKTYFSPKKEFICIEITDNGLGIDLNKNKNKIFGLYNRFHNHVEGKGLGLHITKTQIERMGGKIEVESAPDKGSSFKLSFVNTIINDLY
ncbi:MAG: PAS domain-containing protein [Bacteroidia bacterium]|nr:PAS domain-containing protein [Bacteroidia bacterium]